MKRLIMACLMMALAQSGLTAGKIEERAQMKDGATLKVINVAGSITISGWRKNEIEVIADLGEEAERLVFDAGADSVLVEVEQRERKDRERYSYSGSALDIKVPYSTHLKIKAVSADVKISDIRGNQRVRTVSGDLTTSVEGDEAELRSVSGDIVAMGKGKSKGGEFTLYSVSGNVTSEGLGGEVRGEAVSGDLEISASDLSDVHLKTVSGDIEGRLGLLRDARVNINSVSGDIEMQLPANFAAEYELTSFSGDIADLFGNRATRKSKYAPGSELSFTQGSSKARIRVNTMSGDIELTPDM